MLELNRFLRHALAPVVVYAVAQGWLPESAQGDVLEALVMAGAFLVPWALSYVRDPNRGQK